MQANWEWINWFYYCCCPNSQHKSPITHFKLVSKRKTNICTNPQSPISNLFQNITPTFAIHMYDPTLSRGERLVAKVEPTVKVIVKYPETSVRSQCMYLKPLPATTSHIIRSIPAHYVPSNITPNILYCTSIIPTTDMDAALFLLGPYTSSAMNFKREKRKA
jgi:hypothetical protein